MKPVDTTDMLPIIDIVDVELNRLASEATTFLQGHQWCKRVISGWNDRAWNDHVAVFYFKIEPTPVSRADSDVWVIVGDIPPAYIRTKGCENGIQALRAYVEDMKDWVEHVRLGLPTENDVPVNVPAETRYAHMLDSRLQFIERELLSEDMDGDTD